MIHSSSLPNWGIKRNVSKERASSFVRASVMWWSTEIVIGWMDCFIYVIAGMISYSIFSYGNSSTESCCKHSLQNTAVKCQYIVFLLILFFVNHVLASNPVFTVGMRDMVWSEIGISSARFVHGFCACFVCLSVWLFLCKLFGLCSFMCRYYEGWLISKVSNCIK